jgi:hypothetical protein
MPIKASEISVVVEDRQANGGAGIDSEEMIEWEFLAPYKYSSEEIVKHLAADLAAAPSNDQEGTNMASKSKHVDAKQYCTMLLGTAARQAELLSVPFSTVLHGRANAHASAENFESPEAKKALHTSRVHIGVAHLVNAGKRLLQLGMSEAEVVERLQYYPGRESGGFVGKYDLIDKVQLEHADEDREGRPPEEDEDDDYYEDEPDDEEEGDEEDDGILLIGLGSKAALAKADAEYCGGDAGERNADNHKEHFWVGLFHSARDD